jgi:hypothetical protein
MTTLTQPRSLTLKLETAFIFLLGLAIFVSKPLIYLSILLLIGVTLARIATDSDYRYELFDNKLFWASSGVFVFGLLSTIIGSGYAEDIGWMASKTMLLPMVVPLLLAFTQKTNRTAAIAGAVVGFWIAFVLTGNMHNWTWSGDRYGGATWLIDTWGVICAMLILLLTPLVFLATQNKTARGILAFTLLGGIVMLLTNGARGPWLGVLAGVLVYLAMKQRKALLVVAVLVVAAIFGIANLLPKQVEALKHRAESITDFETNPSSYLRLAMWETGYALITKQLVTGDKGFWFGYRKKGKGDLANDFYYNEFIDQAKVKPGVLKEYNWKLTDFHNSYLESVFRNGILWTLGSLFILAWLAIGPLQRGHGWSTTWVAVPSLIGFLVIGMTYTLLPHFAFLFLIFFMALGRGFDR